MDNVIEFSRSQRTFTTKKRSNNSIDKIKVYTISDDYNIICLTDDPKVMLGSLSAHLDVMVGSKKDNTYYIGNEWLSIIEILALINTNPSRTIFTYELSRKIDKHMDNI